MPSNIERYIELAPPQLLDDKWRELSFDLASSHNVLQDCIMPESGSGYVYRDAKSVGSATHNRFIYWRTSNDVLDLIEISTEVNLEDNQVRIRFVNSPIVNSIGVIEFSDSLAIVLATMTSVHRILLPHPKTINRSVFSSLTSDVLFDPGNYYLLGNTINTSSNKPICATSWCDNSQSLIKCALSFPDSSILIVQFGFNTHHINTCEIKQTGIIGRLWSRMPNLWAKSPDECDNAIFASITVPHEETNDVLLVTLCRDCRIRIFSTNTKECVCSFNMIPQSSFHQSFAAHTNPSTEIPMIRMLGSYMVIYLAENKPEFVLLEHSCSDGVHELKECITLQAPDWSKLLDFGITRKKIWALANMCETESTICYMDIASLIDSASTDASMIEGSWDVVHTFDIAEPPNSKSLVAEIFWRNHFSVTTVQKALIGISGPSIPKKDNMEALEELALTRIVSEDQDTAWRKFYEYCLQNHSTANKCIGLILSEDESIVGVVKRSNPSFVCPWNVNVDVVLQEGPYRGMEFSHQALKLVEVLNYISSELLHEDQSMAIDEKLIEDPNEISALLAEETTKILSAHKHFPLKIRDFNRATTLASIDYICNELDLTEEAKDFNLKMLGDYTTKMKSEHNPLGSSHGIMLTFELFSRVVKARLNLARDLLIYINLISNHSDEAMNLAGFCEDLYTSGRVRRLLNSLRSYATMNWLVDSPVKNQATKLNSEVIDHVARHFEFFKRSRHLNSRSGSMMEYILHRNLLTYFLTEGGVNFHWQLSQFKNNQQALSDSYYITETVFNLCKLLWPRSNHLCIDEFMLTNQLDEHLSKYLIMTQGWVGCCEPERHFINACNCMLQNRGNQAVEIFNRLWTDVSQSNLIGRFMELNRVDYRDGSKVDFCLIEQYYGKLIQFFQLYNNRQCLVMLINNCMSLLETSVDGDQLQSMNTLRATLFQYYLELEDPDEAYHTMVLTSDPSLRINCLRKFIVSHCEKEQWINLLSYPFIDIKHDFIDILNQKAESLDLSSLDSGDFYRTSYYDLLFASHVMDEDYKHAAEVMYSYSQRLAQEVPGITSIRKQIDCLLIALNSLRCVDEKDQFIECRGTNYNTNGRTSMLKRSHDCESNYSSRGSISDCPATIPLESRVSCQDIEKKYELTKARLRLLEKDQTTNAIAMSPLKPEETINQLVASSMFASALDLASLFRAPMEPILEGLAAKYVLVMRLSTADILVYQDVERGLTDLFMNSYSTIDTYNYIANSTSPLIDRLWRLIDHYLSTYDGVSHKYRSNYIAENSSPTTVLMRVVANKLLSGGYDVPASLRRLYMMRNPSELLKLMMKYDKLAEASELATEMVDRTLEPVNCYAMIGQAAKVERPPVYLPTHLILLLITFLNEDATDTLQLKMASALADRLDKFRAFVRTN